MAFKMKNTAYYKKKFTESEMASPYNKSSFTHPQKTQEDEYKYDVYKEKVDKHLQAEGKHEHTKDGTEYQTHSSGKLEDKMNLSTAKKRAKNKQYQKLQLIEDKYGKNSTEYKNAYNAYYGKPVGPGPTATREEGIDEEIDTYTDY